MKINQRKAGAVLSYVAIGISTIVSILFTPIMLHLLGQSDYGLYNLVASIVSFLSLFTFGFGSAYIRYYSKYTVANEEENIAKLNGMFLTVFSIIGLVALLAGIILVLNIDIVLGSKFPLNELATARILMIIMVFNLTISFPFSIFSSYITANERYIFLKSLQIIKSLISPLVMLPILLLGYGSVGLVIVTTLISIVIEISNTIFCFKKLNMKFLFKKFDFKLMKEMGIYSSYIFINMIVDQINWNVDKYIIGRFKGTLVVAVYGIAAQLNSYYMTFSTSIANVFTPMVHKMNAMKNSNKNLTELFTRVGRIQFIILLLIFSGFIIFGRSFINKWAGTNYDGAYIIALILMFSITIPLTQNVGIEIQRAKNMHQFRSWLYLFIAILNIILTIPLTKQYGGVGAAIGTAFAQILGNTIIMNWYYHKKVGLDMRFFWKNIIKFIPAFIAPAIIGIYITSNIDLLNIINFLIFIILYVLIFGLSMWLLGMNKYEKDLTLKLFKRVKPKRL